MRELFSTILGMSTAASIVILVVLLVRLALRKAPRVFSYALWAVVLFRLLCPIVLESPLGLIPSAQIVSVSEKWDIENQIVQVQTGIQAVDGQVNDFFAQHPYQSNAALPTQVDSEGNEVAPPLQQLGDGSDWRFIPTVVWLTGMTALLVYSGISLLQLRRRLVGAAPLEDENGVWLADHIETPFVLGLFRPKIYLPSALADRELDYVLLHERTHIRRLDHLFRALAWLVLALHWFNPLVWLAFHLAGKDMEMSCDEAVLRRMGRDIRADYSSSLLRLSVGKRLPVGPLAFGDGDPQSRIKNVLNYKKPTFWVIVVALIAVLLTGVALATNRAKSPASDQTLGGQGPAELWLDYYCSDEMPWDGSEETQLPEYPGVTFRWTPEKVTAVDGDQETTLIEGMPVWSVYLCDLTGDGKRELCATVSIGSGIIDDHIVVYDYANGASYTLQGRMVYDYHLRLQGQQLWAVEYDYNAERGEGTKPNLEGPLILMEPDVGNGPPELAIILEIVVGSDNLPPATTPSVSYSLNENGQVVIQGLDSSRPPLWCPPEPGEEDGVGELITDAPYFLNPWFEDSMDILFARWTDESRTALCVRFFSYSSNLAVIAATPPNFTADLTAGTVAIGDVGKSDFGEPHRFTDDEMLTMAQALADIMRGAEDWYAAQQPAVPSGGDVSYFSSGSNIVIEGLDASYLEWHSVPNYSSVFVQSAYGYLYIANPRFLGGSLPAAVSKAAPPCGKNPGKTGMP